MNKDKKLVITYNTPIIFDSEDDKSLLLKTLEKQREVYNLISTLHFGNKNNSLVELHKKVYHKIRNENEIPSNILILTEREVLSNYRTVKTNKHKIEKPIEKKNLSVRLNFHTYKFKTDHFRLSTIKERINVKFHIYPKLEECFAKYKLCDPLIFVRDGKLYFSLSFEIYSPTILKPFGVGVDLGVNRLATTSEGIIFQDKPFLAKKRSIRHLKDKLQSKGSRSAKRHLKKLRHKERNINNNFNHHLTNAILRSTNANVIILEDLTNLKKNIKSKKKYLNLNKLSQVSFYIIRQMLTYKAPLYGKRVETVNPSHTSQIDHRTGRKRGIRQGRRFISKRGLIYDADVNAAINIVKRSKLPFSYCSRIVLLGQATVSTPIVGIYSNKPLNLFIGG